ncbi:MAG: hypothetical protein QNJ45_20520 [Ardenticatenaceae bacterium]|nr:hypothetical protein [Ardenticatenaceae bacterium]
MNHLRLTILILSALVLFGLFGPADAQENLLRNPGFEGDYFAWNGIPEVQVAHDWTPWWVEDPNRDPRWNRPEWKRAQAAFFPNRVRSGASSQQWFTFYASHYGGMYQQVFNVTPGQTYRFSVWVQVWSSLEDNALESVSPANPRLQVGIEPNGIAVPGLAWPPGSVIWSFEAPMDQAIDGWAYMSVDAVAQNETITVYLRTSPDFANKHNDIYIDDAQLILVSDAPPPPPPPTATVPTVEAAEPTSSPTAAAASATATSPPPTATATAEPTATPTVESTATATVEPTATAIPTNTPSATPTEPPTQTPVPPTATAEPTNTVTATVAVQAVADADGAEEVESEPLTAPTDPGSGFSWWWLLLLLIPLGGAGFWLLNRDNS